MTDVYNDLIIRRTMSDDGSIPYVPPSGEVPWHSPDIIPLGLDSRPDIVEYLTSNKNVDLGQDISIGKPNYIYVRGMNLFDGNTEGKVHLYYSPASLLLYPNRWSKNELLSGDGNDDYVPVNSQNKGDIFVGASPFVWIPSRPDVGDHYCLIARVETERHPNLVPNVGDVDDLSKFILNNPGWAQRNVAFTNADIPTYNETIGYTQGTLGGDMYVLLTVTNAPEGSEIELSCPGTGPSQPIYIPKQEVKYDPSTASLPIRTAVYGIRTMIPANFESNITYSYYSNGKAPQKGFNIEVNAYYIVPKGHELYKRFHHPSHYGLPKQHTKNITPGNLLCIGAFTTEFQMH